MLKAGINVEPIVMKEWYGLITADEDNAPEYTNAMKVDIAHWTLNSMDVKSVLLNRK